MKKIFSLIMIAFVAFTAAFVGVATFVIPNKDETSETGGEIGASWSGAGTSSDPYLITSASDLQTLATNVNAGTKYSSSYFLQTADIDLSSISNWTPIGISSTYYFSGTYDGGNYRISNMTIAATANYAGLFGYYSSNVIDSSYEIQNIIMENVNITGSYSYIGSVVGYITGGEVGNCYATGTIAGAGNIGGVAGYLYNGAGIYRCASAVTINATGSNVGGVVGGSNYTAYIEQCYNSGTVTSTGSNVGGIIGYCYRYGRIVNCYNVAPISGASYVGGIVGYYSYYGDSASSSYHIKFCYNTGALKTTSTSTAASTSYIGGIAGVAYDCYVYSNWAYCSITSGSGSYTNSGGIAGSNGSNVYDNYNYFNITNSTVTTDKGGTRDTSLATNAKNSSWTGYNNWSISSSSSTSTWHLASSGNVYPILRSTWALSGGTEEVPFEIASSVDLYKLAFVTNMGVGFEEMYFKQTANIDLSSYSEWLTIGEYSSYATGNFFKGTYDGSGYSISNLTSTNASTDHVGLFGTVYYASLKNITLISPTISASAYDAIGGIVGYAKSSTISNCIVQSATIEGDEYVGGIAGEVYESSIDACSVSGSITALSSNYCDAGGIVGFCGNYASTATLKTISNCTNQATVVSLGQNLGGIVGDTYGYITISNCVNTGTVTGGSANGGIVGWGYGSPSAGTILVVEECYNTGAISGSASSGGIVGYITAYCEITNCYNTGKINATGNYSGGIAGYAGGNSSSYSSVQKCYNKGAVSGASYVGGLIGYIANYVNVYYSYNVGTISGTSYIGGISGRLYSTTNNTVSTCYWDTGCGATYAHGYNSSSTGSTGYSNLDSTTYAKSSSWSMYTSYWDFTDVWMINNGMNDGYPIFKSSFAVGSGGSGTSADPFLISSLEDLQELQKKVNSGNSYSGIYFKQTANVDMKDIANWTPIGNYSAETIYFAGNYNGDGYTIANLTINNSSMYQGLFGYCYGATVSNLRMLNVNITSSAYSGAVSALFVGTISNVSVTGTISGSAYAGGLVGAVTGTTTITECFSLANITASSSPIGGLVGGTSGALTINDCYNRGNLTCSAAGYAGGLVGNSGASMSIYCSYNTGKITTSGGYSGGLVGGATSTGYANMYNCYNLGTVSGSYVGGLSAGYGTNSSSYYDSSCGATYGIRSTSSTTGKTTNLTSAVKAKTWSGYSGWSFSSGKWILVPTANDGLPVLKDFYWTGSGTGTESDPFLISSLANLQLLQTFVNKGEHYEGMYFKQTASISLTSISDWTPIGDYATNDFLWFSGTYKAQGNSITYLRISSSKNYRGLFGYAKNATFDYFYMYNGSIVAADSKYVGTLLGYGTNTHIAKNSSYYSTPTVSGGSYTGAIAGYLGGGSTITNSFSFQPVTGNGHYVGGLVGGLNASTMTNCYRSSSSYSVTNTSYGYTGGLVGYSYNSTIDNCYSHTPVSANKHVGGLVGILDCGTISNSYHTSGKVTASNYAGGIAGQVYNTGKITACYNTAAVNATTKGAGGLVGYLAGTATTKYATVEKSYNSGTITGVTYTGGIIGNMDDFTQVLNCYNTGSVTGTGAYTGGIVGRIDAYTMATSSYPVYIKYCFNKAAVTGTTYIGGIVGYISLDSTYSYVAYSYNVGALSSSSSAATIGGITAYFYSTTNSTFLTNYWDTDCGATYGLYSASSNSGATGYAALDTSTYALNSSWSLYSYWDFTNTWRMLGSSYNSGYPILLCGLSKVTVYFQSNGGSGTVSSITDYYTAYITLPENTFTRTGFVANGWNTSSPLSTSPSYNAGDSYKIASTGAVYLYANWTPVGMTMKMLVYVEHDIDGNTYDPSTSTISGFSAYFYYYNTTFYSNGTSSVELKTTGAEVSGSARINQSVTVYVALPTNYICTAIVVNNETPTHSSKLTSKTVSLGTGMSGYDSSNYYGEVRIYIKKVSGNHIEYQ